MTFTQYTANLESLRLAVYIVYSNAPFKIAISELEEVQNIKSKRAKSIKDVVKLFHN